MLVPAYSQQTGIALMSELHKHETLTLKLV